MNKLKTTLGDYNVFLDDILTLIVEEKFDTADFSQMDHICYRTASLQNYYDKKKELEAQASLLGETMVNGRPISTFRLNEPIIHGAWRIDAIELPVPKATDTYTEGLEHVEFVLYSDLPTFAAKYPEKQFEMRASDRGINPEIGYKLGKYGVKFHMLSLGTVLYLENILNIREVKDGQ